MQQTSRNRRECVRLPDRGEPEKRFASAAAGRCTDDRVVLISADIGEPTDLKNEPNIYDIANVNRLARLVSATDPNQRLDLVYRDVDGTPVQIGSYR